ncbi:hypothetical protein RDI58_020925 [Solanum bulbocastanum]|uniref:Uncharacterized protein n=1 Tax=Solanum bulbocastanum TaxID=147425 RepID=A0AAN8Y883_SOLBU
MSEFSTMPATNSEIQRAFFPLKQYMDPVVLHFEQRAIVPTPIATVRQKPPEAVHVAKRPATKWGLEVQITLCSWYCQG